MRTHLLLTAILSAAASSFGTLLIVHLLHPADAQEGQAYYAVPGDVNGDGGLNIADPIYLLNYIFAVGPPPTWCEPCPSPIFTTGQTRCFDETGVEIPCDSPDYPGMDGFYQNGIWPSYTVNDDRTVTDNITGLQWQRVPSAQLMTWKEALKYCDDLNLAGYDDWRLPNVKELYSIAIPNRIYPAASEAFEFMNDGSYWWYWTSSNDNDYACCLHFAWAIDFGSGRVEPSIMGTKLERFRVRAVRGPTAPPP